MKKAKKKIKSSPLDSDFRADGTRRDLMESLLIKIGQANGCIVKEVSFRSLARAKARSRARDQRLIKTGQATPEEIQKKNYPFSEGIVICDMSKALAP